MALTSMFFTLVVFSIGLAQVIAINNNPSTEALDNGDLDELHDLKENLLIKILAERLVSEQLLTELVTKRIQEQKDHSNKPNNDSTLQDKIEEIQNINENLKEENVRLLKTINKQYTEFMDEKELLQKQINGLREEKGQLQKEKEVIEQTLEQQNSVNCKKPTILNGNTIPETDHIKPGEYYQTKCGERYTISDPAILLCDREGNLYGTVPTCNDKCEMPTIDESSITPLMETIQSGLSYTVSCNSGFDIDGSSTVDCVNGKLSDMPTCKARCKKPSVDDAFIKPTSAWIKSGSSYIVTCKSQFELSGNANVVCDNGELSDLPFCKGWRAVNLDGEWVKYDPKTKLQLRVTINDNFNLNTYNNYVSLDVLFYTDYYSYGQLSFKFYLSNKEDGYVKAYIRNDGPDYECKDESVIGRFYSYSKSKEVTIDFNSNHMVTVLTNGQTPKKGNFGTCDKYDGQSYALATRFYGNLYYFSDKVKNNVRVELFKYE